MKCLKASSLISIVAAVGAIAAVSAPAKAAIVGEAYYSRQAIDCVYSSGATLSTSGNGNIYNSSTTATTTVVCPIEYDYYTAAYGVAGVELTVTDKSTAGNISCALVHVTLNGATATAGTAASTSGTSTSATVLTLLPPAVSATVDGNHLVKCTLPKKGGSSATMTSYFVFIGI